MVRPTTLVTTGLLAEEPFGSAVTPGSGDQRSEDDLVVNDADLKRTIDRLVGPTEDGSDRNWAVALRLLAAGLRGLRFFEVSLVIGINETNLTKILHGEMKLQPSNHARIDRMLGITSKLRQIIDDDAVGDWFRSPIPALKGETPLESVRKRKFDRVEQVVDSYFDPSYS
jgi:hypothetical protein